MFSKTNKSLLVISVIAIVNALGYGIIIPLQYAYISRFGINTFWAGVLFSAFSLAQFLSTPIIGRLSDRFGRKPLLLYSVVGTAVSFLLFAVARSVPLLFFARILDGISGGNISVAQAVISDKTKPEERARWFGILGASFGFGFVFGPAIGGLLSGITLAAPFYFAAVITIIAALLVIFVLEESLDKNNRETKQTSKLFDFRSLGKALFEPFVGLVLTGSFLMSFAFAVFILGFQAFTNDVLKLTPTQISLLFMTFGAIGLVMQGFLVGRLTKRFGEIRLLIAGVVLSALGFGLMGLSWQLTTFVIACVLLAVGNSFVTPLLTALLSKHTRREDQGGIMGINQSYVSLASIIGPLVGGILATQSVHWAFFGAALTLILMLYLTLIISRESGKHEVNL